MPRIGGGTYLDDPENPNFWYRLIQNELFYVNVGLASPLGMTLRDDLHNLSVYTYYGFANITAALGSLSGIASAFSPLETMSHALDLIQSHGPSIDKSLSVTPKVLETIALNELAAANIIALNTVSGFAGLNTSIDEIAQTLGKAIASANPLAPELIKDAGASTYASAIVPAWARTLGVYMNPEVGKEWGLFQGLVNAVDSRIKTLIPDLTEFASGVLKPIHEPAVLFAEGMVNLTLAQMRAGAPATPGNAQRRGLDVLSAQIGLGIEAHLISLAAELVPILKHMGFPQLAAFMVDAAGFRDVARGLITSQIEASVVTPGRYDALSTMSPTIPPPPVLEELYRKRVIGDESHGIGLQVAGYDEFWRVAIQNAVYREPTIRDLAITLEDVDTNPAWLLSAVQRAGYSDEDATRLQGALLKRTTRSARARLVAAAVSGVKKGLLDPSEANQHLEDAGLRPEAITIELGAAQLDARMDLINDTAAVFVQEAKDGLIGIDELSTLLTSIGVGQMRRNVMVLQVMARLGKKRLDEEETATQVAIREAQRFLIPLYRDLFRSGVLSAAAFEQALRAIGIRDELAASIVSLEQARYVAGIQERQVRDLAAFTRRILAERGAILTLEVNAGLIDLAAYERALLDLGVSAAETATLVLEARVRLAAKAKVATELSAEAQARAVIDERRRLLTDLFRAGQITGPEFLMQLIAAGVNAELAELIVEREQLALDLAGQP